MLKHTALFISFSLIVLLASAQRPPRSKDDAKQSEKLEKRNRINTMIRNEEEGIPAYEKHFNFSFKSNHDGYGILFEKGKMKTPYKSSIFQFEFGEKQHLKEEKQTPEFNNGGFAIFGKPFVFGKQNIFYQLKLGAGQQILIGGKANKNGVAVYAIAVAGFTAGLSRPYYMEFATRGGSEKIKYTEATRSTFLNPAKVIGGTGWQLGWNEMKFSPGAYAKGALRFDWARFNHVVDAIEFGFGFDYYAQKIVQMVDNPGKSFFPTGSIGLVFGNRK